ncbi:hypothetical protein HAX54_039133 [Datura stramonium]|uniref:Uncharacterized protein n=1 Tax=Datura stramonium TaxID=4076 RepID=A0ABS8RNI6_DATST|nr:hypothetical protein [Datura stramonium]
MFTSRLNSKGKAPMTNIVIQDIPFDEAQRIAQLCFGLARKGDYYVSVKEKRSIYAETQFEVESFKDDFPDIYYQIGIWDWGPFTIPVGPYFPELVCEFYASYRAKQRILKRKGRVDTMTCLSSMSPLKLQFLSLASWIRHTSMLEKSLWSNSKGRPSSRQRQSRILAFYTDPQPSSNIDLHEPTVVPTQSKWPKIPPDDWWVGFYSSSKIVSYEEIYHSRPPPCRMLTVREVDPSWKQCGVDNTSYHDLRIL